EPQVGSGRCRGRPAHVGDDEDLARRDREREGVFTAVEMLAPEVCTNWAREFVAAEADEVCHGLADVREHRGGAARPRGLAGARRQREERDGRCEEHSLADLAHANPLSSGEFQSRARTDLLSSAPFERLIARILFRAHDKIVNLSPQILEQSGDIFVDQLTQAFPTLSPSRAFPSMSLHPGSPPESGSSPAT